MEQIAVIAGVGPGLGAALARKFVEEGCNVALLSRSSAYIKNLSTRLAKSGRTAIPIPTDITDAEQVERSFDRIREELGDPDILVNHAGNAAWGSFADLTPEAFEGARGVSVPSAGFSVQSRSCRGCLKKAAGIFYLQVQPLLYVAEQARWHSAVPNLRREA